MGKKPIYFVIVLVFFAYVAWMIGPYLRSVIVRRTITARLHLAAAWVTSPLTKSALDVRGLV